MRDRDIGLLSSYLIEQNKKNIGYKIVKIIVLYDGRNTVDEFKTGQPTPTTENLLTNDDFPSQYVERIVYFLKD